VTGSLKFGSRSKFLEYALEHGYESKAGVSKGLTYLVNNDINSNSSKNRKAKELAIKIISEDDFMNIIEASTVECSLQDL
jgi:DNA ligase (NAD+)